MAYKVYGRMHGWNHYTQRFGSGRYGAYVIAHGNYKDSYGFTTLSAPSTVRFYVLHGHSANNVEIFQKIDYQRRIRSEGEEYACKPKLATSLLGKGGPCWNYQLIAWPEKETMEFVRRWEKGRNEASRDNTDWDLFMLPAGEGGILSNPPNCMLNDFFEMLKSISASYDVIDFLCCRTSSDSNERPRPDPGSIAGHYQQSNPYWAR